MRFCIPGIALLIFTASAAFAHEDVVPYAVNGKLATGGHDDILETDNVVQRVFGYDFGEDPLDPYFIGDPGFNSAGVPTGIYPNDAVLPANFTLGFDVLSTLQYWDGTGGVSFSPAPVDVTLGLNRASSTVLISGTGQSGTVPTIGSTGASGLLHVHVNSLLNSSDGIDPLEPNASDGIYLVGLELKLPGSGLANSDPIYFVYNNGLDEEIHDEAIGWVEMNLVPEPAGWLTMAAGLAALATCRWARRRQRRLANR
jgi:hypothetical protein